MLEHESNLSSVLQRRNCRKQVEHSRAWSHLIWRYQYTFAQWRYAKNLRTRESCQIHASTNDNKCTYSGSPAPIHVVTYEGGRRSFQPWKGTTRRKRVAGARCSRLNWAIKIKMIMRKGVQNANETLYRNKLYTKLKII